MKRIPALLILQAILALVSGFLISKMSWIGRVGINWVMPQYRIFKSWWKMAVVLFLVQSFVVGILWLINRKSTPGVALLFKLVFLLIGITGLYFTYNDFQSSFSHKLMREKFHLGFYLFWLGWIGSSVSFLMPSKSMGTNTVNPVAEG